MPIFKPFKNKLWFILSFTLHCSQHALAWNDCSTKDLYLKVLGLGHIRSHLISIFYVSCRDWMMAWQAKKWRTGWDSWLFNLTWNLLCLHQDEVSKFLSQFDLTCLIKSLPRQYEDFLIRALTNIRLLGKE